VFRGEAYFRWGHRIRGDIRQGGGLRQRKEIKTGTKVEKSPNVLRSGKKPDGRRGQNRETEGRVTGSRLNYLRNRVLRGRPLYAWKRMSGGEKRKGVFVGA